jgi:hypothetical protein
MPKYIIAIFVLIGAFQTQRPPLVNRVFVATEQNAGIVFEYAKATLPEDQPATPKAIDCLKSQLMATGLFSEIRVTLKPIYGEEKVDVDIHPIWNESRNKFLIDEITIEGFTSVDKGELIKKLRQKGLRAGALLLSYPPATIREIVLDSVREIYQSDFKRMNEAEEEISDFSLRLESVAPRSVKLTLTKASHFGCQ